MKMFPKITSFSFILASLFLLSCSVKHQAQGKLDEIYVVADSLDWVANKPALKAIFSKGSRMPVWESEYLLHWVPYRKFPAFREFRNIFFLARLDSKEPVSRAVKKLLSSEIKKGIRTGRYFYIPKKDAWAFGQYVLFFVAPTQDALTQRIYDLGEAAYDDFEKSYYRRLKKSMFAQYENKKLEMYLERHFPFTLRVEHDYFVADESLKKGYVWLRRFSPDRSLLIHWLPLSDSIKITPKWVIKERNRLAGIVYSGDVIVEEETTAKRVRFANRPALRLEGTWKNPKLVIGGPFRDMTFVDQRHKLIFMVDLYVQAIGKRKKPFLDQLEIIASTFKVLGMPEKRIKSVAGLL